MTANLNTEVILGSGRSALVRELLPAFDWPEHRHGTGQDHRCSLEAIDLELRPVHHWTEIRVRAHVFICMLAAHLVWHLRQAGRR